jgi:lipopolysaccharide/colanic/teichoic acid biosynthesis glycosyltransferase
MISSSIAQINSEAEPNVELREGTGAPVRCGLSRTQHRVKRALDVVLSGTALLVFAPLFVLLALPIKLESPGPVIYKQMRFGRNRSLFCIYKFRSMHLNTPELPTDQMQKLPSPVTRIGQILRTTSMDELPQIMNVFMGQMSLVGPRPALHNQDRLIVERDALGLNDLKPGITGWAQINGRDLSTEELKVQHDKWYFDNYSIWLDLKIIAKTIPSILMRNGVS